jgi:thermitase
MSFARRLAPALALALCLVLPPCVPGAHADPSRPAPRSDTPAGERLILKLKAGNRFIATTGALRTRAPGLDRALARHDARDAVALFPEAHADLALREKLGLDRYYVVRLDHGADVRAAVTELAGRADVDAVEGPAQGKALGTQSVIPNDSSFADQWSLRNIGTNVPNGTPGADIKATDAWDVTTGDSAIIVAVLDTGIRLTHPDIVPKLWTNTDEIPGNGIDDDGNGYVDDVHGYNFAYESNDITDFHGHGTAVSSILGAATNNSIGIAGVDWKCKLMPVAVLNDRGGGFYEWMALGIYYAVNNGARVISMSLAGEEPSPVLQSALQYAIGHACFVAVAMGNDGGPVPLYPASYPEAFAVGATDGFDGRAGFSSFGPHIDAMAPGVGISVLSAFNDTTVFRVSGTSASTPMVAGLASLLLASHHGALRPEQIRDIIEVTADDGTGDPFENTPGWDPYYGYGRINCDRALRLDRIPRPPFVSAPATAQGIEMSELRVDVTASDPDGDPIRELAADLSDLPPYNTASFTAAPDGLSGTLTWTPTLEEAGRYVVTFIASDPLRGFAHTVITIDNLNQAPTLTAPPTVKGREGEDLLFTIRGTDPDNDLLTLTSTSLPPGARFSDTQDNTGFLVWQPSVGQAGSHQAVFLALDGHGGSATATTQIEIAPADHPPVIAAPAEVAGDEGTPIVFGVSASDPDGDPITSLTMDLDVLPAGHGASFTLESGGTAGTFSWMAGYDAAGAYHLVVTAESGHSSTTTVLLEVGNVDRGPEVAAPSPTHALESAPLDILVLATDPDGDPIRSLTSGPLPEGASFVADPGNASGHVVWTPGFDQAGVYQVTISAESSSRAEPASAAVLLGSATLEIQVANMDRAPTADAGGPYAGALGAPIDFDGGGSSDPDGDLLTYLWSYGDGSTATGVHASHAYQAPGQFVVTLRVDDGSLQDGATTSASILGVLPASAFLPDGHRTVSLVSGSSALRVLLQPQSGSFAIEDLDLSSLRLTAEGLGEVSEIAAESGKTSISGDRNRDGILEVEASFRRSDLRLLLSAVKGRTTVPAVLEGSLTTGAPVRGAIDLVVVGGGSASSVSLSPNPLVRAGTLTVRSAADGPVTVRLFDCHGRLVRTLMDGWRSAGYHDVALDRLDGAGASLATGIYFVRAETSAGTVVERITVMK